MPQFLSSNPYSHQDCLAPWMWLVLTAAVLYIASSNCNKTVKYNTIWMTAVSGGSNTPVFHKLCSISIYTLLKHEHSFQTSFCLAKCKQRWKYGLTVGRCVTALSLKIGNMAPKYNSEVNCVNIGWQHQNKYLCYRY